MSDFDPIAVAKVEATTRKLPRFRRMELILTEGCNLGCSYCFEYNANHKKEMSWEVASECVTKFIEKWSRSSGSVGISFMGGEPLIQYPLIKRIIALVNRVADRCGKFVSFDMQTNGVLLDEEIASYFRETNVRYCLSLDGTEATNDRFRKTLGGGGTYRTIADKLPMLKNYQRWQGARMTVMPTDAKRIGENIQLLHEDLAINQFIVGFATHVTWSDQEIADYAAGLIEAFDYFFQERVERKSRNLRIGLFELGMLSEAYADTGRNLWGCGAGSGRMAVSPDGTFHGCSKLAWSTSAGSESAPLPLGDYKTGFSQPENRKKLLNHTETVRPKCQNCELASRCNGGCHAASIADTGDMYIPADYYCKLMFAQKEVSDYARERMRRAGLSSLAWSKDIPDLTEIE